MHRGLIPVREIFLTATPAAIPHHRPLPMRALVPLCLAVACRAPRPAPARDATPAPPQVVASPAAPDVPFAPDAARSAGCGHAIPGPMPTRAVVHEHTEAYGARAAPRHVHLTFVGDPAHTITAQWATDEATLASEVRYRAAGEAVDRVARGYSFTYPGNAGVRQHRAHLCDLAPGRRHEYDVGGGAHRSARFEFVTAPDGPEPVRLLVTGDSRSDPAVWRAVAARALRERPDAMIFTGDAVVDGSQQPFWDAFFEAAPELLARVPAWWVDGNHEGINAVTDAQFAYAPNGDARYHGRWWAATYGPLRLVGLNDVTLPPWGVIRRTEAEFLARELAAVDRARTPWVATAHHAPMHTTSGGHDPDLATRRVWGELLDRFHVDLDLAGHTHNYQSSRPMLHDETLTPRGTRYLVFGGAGAPLYQFHGTAPWVERQETTHGYAILSLDARRWRWEAFRADGSRIETLSGGAP